MALKIVSDFRLVRNSDVENRIFLEIVTKNGSLFTNMISPARVTFRYRDIMVAGILVYVAWTAFGVFRTVLPMSDPTSGPNIRSAAMMSSRLTGQFWNKFLSTMPRNVLVLGLPMIFCTFRASTAFE